MKEEDATNTFESIYNIIAIRGGFAGAKTLGSVGRAGAAKTRIGNSIKKVTPISKYRSQGLSLKDSLKQQKADRALLNDRIKGSNIQTALQSKLSKKDIVKDATGKVILGTAQSAQADLAQDFIATLL